MRNRGIFSVFHHPTWGDYTMCIPYVNAMWFSGVHTRAHEFLWHTRQAYIQSMGLAKTRVNPMVNFLQGMGCTRCSDLSISSCYIPSLYL